MLNLALYHPQIPQNTGTLLRLASCLGIHIDLIRPFGFIFDTKKLKRAGMDYIATADYEIHPSFNDFCDKYKNRRIIALETENTSKPFCDFTYDSGDILVVGSEHYGILEKDLAMANNSVRIPMLFNRRSINMAIAASIVLSEAMSQLKMFQTL